VIQKSVLAALAAPDQNSRHQLCQNRFLNHVRYNPSQKILFSSKGWYMIKLVFRNSALRSLAIFLLAVIFSDRLMGDSAPRRRPESLVPIAAKTKAVDVDDHLIVKRLMGAYQHSMKDPDVRGNSMWKGIYEEHHKAYHEIFMSDVVAASAILRNPGTTKLFYGIDNHFDTVQSFLEADSGFAHHLAVCCLDGLVRFAEAIGAIRLDNPESYPYLPAFPLAADDVVNRIEQVLGPLAFPNPYPNEFGCLTSKGIFSYRVPQALYQAWRIKQLLRGIEHPRVLEIGAGLGRTAYYAHQLGIEDYTIVDLPFTAVLSGYFLGRCLGGDRIVLSGEEVSLDTRRLIKIITPAVFLEGNDSYDLIINADSLTEMDPAIAKAYWNRIEANGGIFLSINHELNSFTAKDLIDKGTRVSQADRSPYWMRDGYIEEVVKFKPMASSSP
jgi:SAM-dependent methyltransferase